MPACNLAGYIEERDGAFFKQLSQPDHSVVIDQLGGSPVNCDQVFFCPMCQQVMPLLVQTTQRHLDRLLIIYCFACSGACGQFKVIRIWRPTIQVNLPEELEGLEEHVVPTTCKFPSKHNMKMYRRYEVLQDTEPMPDELDATALLTYLEEYPTTVLRWTSKPFLLRSPLHFKPCKCGAKRTLQFQLLPSALYYLKRKEEVKSLDFGLLLIGICSDMCGDMDTYITEEVIKQSFTAEKEPMSDDEE